MKKEKLHEQVRRGKLPISDKEWIASCITNGHANNLECKIAFCAGFFLATENVAKSLEKIGELKL